METICFEIDSNEEVLNLIDKTIPNIFIHRFSPNYVIEWQNASTIAIDALILKNVSVRNMEFDIQTDFVELKKILINEIIYLDIYQFSNLVPDTLVIEKTPKDSKEMILKHNGLQHIFSIEFDVLTIQSFNSEFINLIKANPLYSERIDSWAKKA